MRAIHTALQIPKDLYEAMMQLAEELGVTKSTIIRMALTKFLRDNNKLA